MIWYFLMGLISGGCLGILCMAILVAGREHDDLFREMHSRLSRDDRVPVPFRPRVVAERESAA